MTPTQLATLARAMGYDVEIDATGGYGVTRVLLCEKTTTTYEVGSSEPIVDYIHKTVFRPHEDAAQAWEVLCWLLSQEPKNADKNDYCVIEVTPTGVYAMNYGHYGTDGWAMWFVPHNNTPADLRRAIVEAAVRVAEAAA